MIRAVILAGGSGTRLWPLSRASHPKQFLLLADGDETMLQATLNRLSDLEVQSSVIICNDEHRFFVAEQLREIDKLDSIILEPVGRNTAPAIALAALSSEDDPLLLVLAADHFIQDQAQFTKTVTDAIPLAESGKLVTFGIVPSEPHTGYGYIKCGEEVTPGFLVDQFVEKPSIKLAQDYVASGEFLWNSGMFLFKASRYLEELKIYRPDIYEACIAAMETTVTDLDFMRINSEAFEACPTESIDYAVMEKTKDAVVVPMNAGWNDIGSWSSLWDISKKDENGNSAYGDTIVLDSYNSYIRADDKLLVALGVSDLVVVSTKDAVMVANKKSVNDVKIIVFKKRAIIVKKFLKIFNSKIGILGLGILLKFTRKIFPKIILYNEENIPEPSIINMIQKFEKI